VSAYTATCDDCGAPFNPHNITRLCAECKLIAHHERYGWHADLCTRAEGLVNVITVLGGNVICEWPGL
jgi:hypothetical protein